MLKFWHKKRTLSCRVRANFVYNIVQFPLLTTPFRSFLLSFDYIMTLVSVYLLVYLAKLKPRKPRIFKASAMEPTGVEPVSLSLETRINTGFFIFHLVYLLYLFGGFGIPQPLIALEILSTTYSFSELFL